MSDVNPDYIEICIEIHVDIVRQFNLPAQEAAGNLLDAGA